MSLSRSLITFAFVREEFARTNDFVQGLMPLFRPIFGKHKNEIFSPSSFAAEVERFYGIKMHPYVAEDWVSRFEAAGFLVALEKDEYHRTYRCANLEDDIQHEAGQDLLQVVDALVDYVVGRLKDHGFNVARDTVEKSIIERLRSLDFMRLLSRL